MNWDDYLDAQAREWELMDAEFKRLRAENPDGNYYVLWGKALNFARAKMREEV